MGQIRVRTVAKATSCLLGSKQFSGELGSFCFRPGVIETCSCRRTSKYDRGHKGGLTFWEGKPSFIIHPELPFAFGNHLLCYADTVASISRPADDTWESIRLGSHRLDRWEILLSCLPRELILLPGSRPSRVDVSSRYSEKMEDIPDLRISATYLLAWPADGVVSKEFMRTIYDVSTLQESIR